MGKIRSLLIVSNNLIDSIAMVRVVLTYSACGSSTSSDRCIGKRIQPRCANAVAALLRGQTAVVGRRGLGPRDREEQGTKRGSFVATNHTRVHIAATAISHRVGLGCLAGKKSREAPRHVPSRPD